MARPEGIHRMEVMLDNASKSARRRDWDGALFFLNDALETGFAISSPPDVLVGISDLIDNTTARKNG